MPLQWQCRVHSVHSVHLLSTVEKMHIQYVYTSYHVIRIGGNPMHMYMRVALHLKKITLAIQVRWINCCEFFSSDNNTGIRYEFYCEHLISFTNFPTCSESSVRHTVYQTYDVCLAQDKLFEDSTTVPNKTWNALTNRFSREHLFISLLMQISNQPFTCQQCSQACRHSQDKPLKK